MSKEQHLDDEDQDSADNDIERFGSTSSNNDPAESEDDNEDLSEVDRYWPPPIENSIKLTGSYSFKTVAAFAFNNAGTRFAAGGNDHEIRIWDFDDFDTQRYCSTQPCGQTAIKGLDYSNNDELILVISGGCQAVIIAKDGIVAKQYQCPKGDQYLSDMANTKGHVQMLNDGCWNLKDDATFITCSNDATIRIWDLNKLSQQKTVIKTRSPMSGLKAVPNVCKYSRDSLSIVAGCSDGSVMMWDTRRKFITTSVCIKNAHLKGSEITGIDYSYGPNKICTRSEDESCKIWDSRKLKEPVSKRTGLPTLYSGTECSFSPDDRFILTGVSMNKQNPSGGLLFLSAEDLDLKRSIEVPEASVIRSRWHPKINHIGYSCSNGLVFVAADKQRSMGGLLLESSSSGKGVKRKKYLGSQSQLSSSSSSMKIITPHALPLFRDDQSSSSFAKIRQDPRRSYKPEMPVTGSSEGGRVKPAGSTLSSYIAKNMAKPVDDGGLDIRERILRHAEEAEREPIWIKPTEDKAQHKHIHTEHCSSSQTQAGQGAKE